VIIVPLDDDVNSPACSMMLELLSKKAAKVIVLNKGEFDSSEEVVNNVAQVINGNQKISSVTYCSTPIQSSNKLVYNTHQDVMKTYELIRTSNSAELKTLFAGIESVYIPEDIMQVDPLKKQVVLEHLRPYRVQFYENAYKRVVFYHISRFHDVHFYKKH
jgi:hypothetical protein